MLKPVTLLFVIIKYDVLCIPVCALLYYNWQHRRCVHTGTTTDTCSALHWDLMRAMTSLGVFRPTVLYMVPHWLKYCYAGAWLIYQTQWLIYSSNVSNITSIWKMLSSCLRHREAYMLLNKRPWSNHPEKEHFGSYIKQNEIPKPYHVNQNYSVSLWIHLYSFTNEEFCTGNCVSYFFTQDSVNEKSGGWKDQPLRTTQAWGKNWDLTPDVSLLAKSC